MMRKILVAGILSLMVSTSAVNTAVAQTEGFTPAQTAAYEACVGATSDAGQEACAQGLAALGLDLTAVLAALSTSIADVTLYTAVAARALVIAGPETAAAVLAALDDVVDTDVFQLVAVQTLASLDPADRTSLLADLEGEVDVAVLESIEESLEEETAGLGGAGGAGAPASP